MPWQTFQALGRLIPKLEAREQITAIRVSNFAWLDEAVRDEMMRGLQDDLKGVDRSDLPAWDSEGIKAFAEWAKRHGAKE